MSVAGSEYLEWAKLQAPAPWSLAGSAVREATLADLGVSLDDLELSGPGGYGYPPLVAGLAARYGVAADQVVTAAGTSMANHLAMAALVAPGDEVLIERPTYEPLLALAGRLGARVTRFERRAADGFAVDADAVARALTPATRLVVLTNLHNPSGAYCDPDTLRAVGIAGARVGARVLVDEVYLDAVEPVPATAARLGPGFVVTSSLTKVYGLSGLRSGWILAEPALVRRIWRLVDLYENHGVHLGYRLSTLALGRLDELRRRALAIVAVNRAALARFLDGRRDLTLAAPPAHGTLAFPRLSSGDANALCARLAERYQVAVVPGRFFEAPAHLRLGLGGDPEVVQEALARLGAALDERRGG